MLIKQLIRDQLEKLDQTALDKLYNRYVLENSDVYRNSMVFRSPNNTLKKQEIAYNMAKGIEAEERTRMLSAYYVALAIKQQGQKVEQTSSSGSSFHYVPSADLPKILKTADKSSILSEVNKIIEAIRECNRQMHDVFSKMQNSLKIHSQSQLTDLEIERELEAIEAKETGQAIFPDAPFKIEPSLKPSQLVPKFDPNVYKAPVQIHQSKPEYHETRTALQQQRLANQAIMQAQETEILWLVKQLGGLIRRHQVLMSDFNNVRREHSSIVHMDPPTLSPSLSSLFNMTRTKIKNPEEEAADQLRPFFNNIAAIDTSYFRR